MGRGDGVPLPTGERSGECAPSQNFFYSLVYKWLVLVHSATNLYTDGMLLNARSSAKVYNTAVETNSKFTSLISKSSIRITRETTIISQKIEGFGGRPPVGGRPVAQALP